MSDSSKSVQKSFEKSIKFGEKEPKEEVFSDDEPARKRSKKSENSENFQDSSENFELKRKIQKLESENSENSKKLKDSKNVIEEMGLWMKKLEKLHDDDIDFLKKSINDLAGNLRQEFAEKLQKIDKTEDVNSLKKSINDSIAKLEQKMTEKSEEGHKKLKQDFNEKIQEIKNIHQEKIDNFYEEIFEIKKDCQEKIDKNDKTNFTLLKIKMEVLAENLREEFAEKAEEDRDEQIDEKIDNLSYKFEKMEKNYRSKIAELQNANEMLLKQMEIVVQLFSSSIRPNPPGNLYQQGGFNQQMGPQPTTMIFQQHNHQWPNGQQVMRATQFQFGQQYQGF
ncbi:hypothetical protein B9Z55_003471 [Caenorhabditis nigoni]|uniref:Uncharacterized protein n=1 Tax=Caenorhabditis nigoni TaxID=1611254 RepID=A0A2G5VQJ3_9PELO|nr:hypothetical protein B9Z55_003471 [Caenorhabditis nigoni]